MNAISEANYVKDDTKKDTTTSSIREEFACLNGVNNKFTINNKIFTVIYASFLNSLMVTKTTT